MDIFGIIVAGVLIICTAFYSISLINLLVYKVPHVATFNEDLKTLRQAFYFYDVSGKKVVDLGSGSGKIVRLLCKEFKAKVTGYEIDASNYYISKILNFFYKTDTRLIKGNYLKADLSHYDCIYIYLYPCLIGKIEEKIFKECSENTLIFVNAFAFKKHTPIKVFQKGGKDQIYVYEV